MLTIELLELVKCTLELPELVTGNFRSVSMDETGNGTGRKRKISSRLWKAPLVFLAFFHPPPRECEWGGLRSFF
jgi:hypothetical protein